MKTMSQPAETGSPDVDTGLLPSILATVGNTPVVRLNKVAPDHVSLYVKIEAFNPLSSVKDRLALGVIEAAEASGELRPGQTVIEATSGNTGLGLAMVCAQKGHPLVIVMSEKFSIERRLLLRRLGAKVILTPEEMSLRDTVTKTKALSEKNDWFLTRQFVNPANARMHVRTTAQEILRSFSCSALDYWVTGFGTGGTLNGVATVLRRERPDTKIIVAEPDVAPMLSSGLGNDPVSDTHPRFEPHPMQGWSPNFLTPFVLEARDKALFDAVIGVTGERAVETARSLAKDEGILVGISSGATLAAALEVAKNAPTGATILAMLPDTGERYLSTELFSDISPEMSAEEAAIAQSLRD